MLCGTARGRISAKIYWLHTWNVTTAFWHAARTAQTRVGDGLVPSRGQLLANPCSNAVVLAKEPRLSSPAG